MAKPNFNSTPEEKMIHRIEEGFSSVVAELKEIGKTLKSIDKSLKSPVAMVSGLQGLNSKQKDQVQKLDEIKSSGLVAVAVLKKIHKEVQKK